MITLTDKNGLKYIQTKYGKIYDTIPKSKILGEFHNYSNKQKI